jgi:hypothetical protein
MRTRDLSEPIQGRRRIKPRPVAESVVEARAENLAPSIPVLLLRETAFVPSSKNGEARAEAAARAEGDDR